MALILQSICCSAIYMRLAVDLIPCKQKGLIAWINWFCDVKWKRVISYYHKICDSTHTISKLMNSLMLKKFHIVLWRGSFYKINNLGLLRVATATGIFSLSSERKLIPHKNLVNSRIHAFQMFYSHQILILGMEWVRLLHKISFV